MRVHYDHVIGKVERNDFQFTRIIAEDVAPDEEQDALDQGFLLVTEHPEPRWENTRSTRIAMDRFVRTDLPLLDGMSHRSTNLMLAAYVDLYDRFIEARGFLPIESDLEFMSRDSVVEYRRDGLLVGFSKLRHYQGAVELQLHCNLVEDRSFGFLTLMHEVAMFEAMPFVYLGPGYETSSIYKARISGFEWWTGREWSQDTAAYVSRCKADSAFAL